MTAPRPKIICLCGSTKFIEQFAIKTWELELQGHIVLGCTLLPAWYCGVRDHFAEKLGVKGQRDQHHLRKIDLADEVLVLNIGGYIGESTRAEIKYAYEQGKPVSYVETEWDLHATALWPLIEGWKGLTGEQLVHLIRRVNSLPENLTKADLMVLLDEVMNLKAILSHMSGGGRQARHAPRGETS